MAEAVPVVAVFTRAPVHGAVKTRLAEAVGDDEALAVHRQLLRTTLDAVAGGGPWHTELWLDRASDDEGLARLRRRHALEVRIQSDGDLGERMLGALRDITARAPMAIIIGSDIPLMRAAYIREAVAALAEHDLVIGPAEDGGYVLIGQRCATASLFRGMTFGRPDVLARTLERARQSRLETKVLDALWDVDTVSSWRRWRALKAWARPWRWSE